MVRTQIVNSILIMAKLKLIRIGIKMQYCKTHNEFFKDDDNCSECWNTDTINKANSGVEE